MLDPNTAQHGVNWSTGLALTTGDVPGKRRANSGFCTSFLLNNQHCELTLAQPIRVGTGWGGTQYVIDPTTGVAIVGGSQVIPTFDKVANELFEKAEEIVYANLEDN
jgi:hypothetical protein